MHRLLSPIQKNLRCQSSASPNVERFRWSTVKKLRPGAVEKMTIHHPRNTGPMLALRRDDARPRTRLGVLGGIPIATFGRRMALAGLLHRHRWSRFRRYRIGFVLQSSPPVLTTPSPYRSGAARSPSPWWTLTADLSTVSRRTRPQHQFTKHQIAPFQARSNSL
jgi:hypothetical protein